MSPLERENRPNVTIVKFETIQSYVKGSSLINLPIRWKIVVPMTTALAVMLISVFFYFPWRYKQTLVAAYTREATRTAELISVAVSHALSQHSFELLQKTLQSAQDDANVLFLLLFDEAGEQLAVYNPQGVPLRDSALVSEASIADRKEAIIIRQEILDQDERTVGRLLLGYSLRGLYAQIGEYRIVTIVLAMAAFLLGFVLLHGVSQRITKSISQLHANMHETIEKGSYASEVSVTSHDEIGRLATAFNKMMTELRSRHQRLVESQKRYRDLYENAPAMYFSLDHNGRILDCNRRALSALGRDKSSVVNSHLRDYLRPVDSSSGDWQDIWQQITTADVVQDMELRLEPQTGLALDVLLNSSCLKPDDGVSPQGNGAGTDGAAVRVALSDISRLKHFEREIIKHNEKLRELDRLKSNFVSEASHHLRTPLTIISGEIEVALTQKRGAAEYLEVLRIVADETKHLAKIVGNLLTLAKADAGNLVVLQDDVDFSSICEAQIKYGSILAKGKRIRFDHKIEKNCLVTGDPDRLAELIFNLVENAVKYTPAGNPITATTESSGDKIIFKVADTGAGIPEEEMTRIFDRFYRGKVSPHKAKGAGLGLAICESIVKAHRGVIEVSSTVGKGSTFQVTIPKQIGQTAADQQV